MILYGIRHLLLEALYIELAQAAYRDLFHDNGPIEFSPKAYEHLKRHTVPFAGAIRIVANDLPSPRSDDPIFGKIRGARKDVLTRRFEGVRVRLMERLREVMNLRHAASTESHQITTPQPLASVYQYLADLSH